MSVDVEAAVDEQQPADAELFACFGCRDVFYFMPDARPAIRELRLFELYDRA